MPLAASGQQQPVPSAAGLQAATAAALASPGPRRATSGSRFATPPPVTHLLDLRSNDPLVPASSLKLLSAAAVDATFPAERR